MDLSTAARDAELQTRSSNMNSKRLTRIIAIDLHPRSFGYVVSESPTALLGWGVCRSYRKTKKHPDALVGRLRQLLKVWAPDAIVARVEDQRRKGLPSLLNRIMVRASFVPITNSPHLVSRTKYERAVQIAARFPEIGWKLPGKRKPWESEHYSMSIFSAAEIAMSFHESRQRVEEFTNSSAARRLSRGHRRTRRSGADRSPKRGWQ